MPIPILTQDGHGTYKPVEPRLPRFFNSGSGHGLGGSGGGDDDDKKKCPTCLGTQNCTKCEGTGIKDSFWGSKDCKRCDGTGVCQTCGGLGYI